MHLAFSYLPGCSYYVKIRKVQMGVHVVWELNHKGAEGNGMVWSQKGADRSGMKMVPEGSGHFPFKEVLL